MENSNLNLFKGIKATIFDLDGTIIDSMWLWDKIDIDFLNKRNISFDPSLKKAIEPLSFNDAAKFFKDHFKLSESTDEIKNEWLAMAHFEYKVNIKLKKGVRKFLEYLNKENIKIALASSNTHDLIHTSLKVNKIHDYFDAIITTDDVKKSKHYPDVFLESATKLKVKPEECIVFEDVLAAVKSAKKANMKVVGVYDKNSEDHKELIIEHADSFITDFEDIINNEFEL
ncbi:MAG: HAD family phosphatase [Lentisphaerae bacterium]|nr:HAD family phosphatase [Lentisphaerota bacterium]